MAGVELGLSQNWKFYPNPKLNFQYHDLFLFNEIQQIKLQF